jgi:hypothetical protein
MAPALLEGLASRRMFGLPQNLFWMRLAIVLVIQKCSVRCKRLPLLFPLTLPAPENNFSAHQEI